MKLDDGILRFYNDELAWLRVMGREFARQYPMVANRLELQDGHPADPHVERLIESFAFLTGRIQHELDAQFPEITTSLLSVLYPHLVQPIPPLAVARFEIDARRGKFTTGHVIPRNSALYAYGSGDVACRFRTCWETTVWPVDVTEVSLDRPARFDFLNADPRVTSVLRLRIAATAGSLADLELESLRLFINPRNGPAYTLYELLFANLLGICILPEDGSTPSRLPATAISAAGFDREEGVLPSPAYAHPGHRLIQEYLHFPEKFLFFDVSHLRGHGAKSYFDLLFLLDRVPREKLNLEAGSFVTGCTPVANLFPRTTEPTRLDQRQLSYRLVADARRERTTEIHSIEKVSGSTNPLDETHRYEPFYSFRHSADGNGPRAFWHARRVFTGREDLPGMDTWLSFLDLDFKPAEPPAEVIFAHTLCTNRWLATEVPPGARLQMEEVGPVIVSTLGRPTPPVYPPLGGPGVWRLISNLSLNHLSLEGGGEGLRSLQEILRVYCFNDQPSLLQQIQGIRELSSRPVLVRTGADAWRGFRSGTEIALTFDEAVYAGGGAFLFATVLRNFLGLYCAANSFTQLVARRVNREGDWKRWPPLAGYQSVL
ncbi:MAG TPA: type VI secretion system baseplate subunit TssF [Bryobacteraceae bacterium]|jgi:type VI secretion system protein ImpG|nr:type VI secretion system baseplate subunit TssF [Bryobacteraceae bacterium]